MISSKEILEKTGLKNSKTLTRWYQQHIIPEPFIRTHPSGRGKMAYWQDSVLDRCLRIVELRKQGHSLHSAVALIEQERIQETLNYVKRVPWISEALEKKYVTSKDGRKTNLLNIFLAVILTEVKRIVPNRDLLDSLITKMKETKVIDMAIRHLDAGYNPVLVFDGNDLDITSDFVVGHRLSHEAAKGKCYLVLPLIAPLRKAFSMVGKELPEKPLAFPAPKIWVKGGDTLVEHTIYIGGPVGFELIRELEKTIDVDPNES